MTTAITTHLITDLLQKEHPDVSYLKQDGIALIISKCLSQTYLTKPKNPIEFFAKSMLAQSKTAKFQRGQREKERSVIELKDKNSYFIKQKLQEHEELSKQEKEKADVIEIFYNSLEKSTDLADNLQELASFLHKFTGSTGVYIGKLEHPRLPIDEQDNDKAHVDRKSAKVVKFVHAYPEDTHGYLKGQILEPNQGITHDVFSTGAETNRTATRSPSAKQAGPADEEEEDEDAAKAKSKKQEAPVDELMEHYYHVYVPEVVREPRMHFYRVPRLGAFLAVPLEYNSCLSQKSLDQAIVDYNSFVKSQEELQKAKKEWDEETEKLKEEKEKAGEPYVHEERTWPELKEKPFLSKARRFVVCLDTLGQDREFTTEERKFALETVTNFAEIWERREQKNLTSDRDIRLLMTTLDKEYNETLSAKLLEDEDDYVKDHVGAILNPMGEDSKSNEGGSRAQTPAQMANAHPYSRMDDEQRDFYQRALRLKYQAQLFTNLPFFQNALDYFSQFTVIKYPRVWQSLFYLLRVPREEICEPETNKFSWKISQHFFQSQAADLLDRLNKYEPLGPKPDEFAYYTTLNFLDKNLEQFQYPEDVDGYSASIVGRLLRWMHAAIKLRRQDVIRRKSLQKKAKDFREEQIQKEAKRQERMQVETQEAEAKFNEDHRDEIDAAIAYANRDPNQEAEEDEAAEGAPAVEKEPAPVMPVFNKQEFLAKWLVDNPAFDIPDPVVFDVDNDWILSQQELEFHINAYFGKD